MSKKILLDTFHLKIYFGNLQKKPGDKFRNKFCNLLLSSGAGGFLPVFFSSSTKLKDFFF